MKAFLFALLIAVVTLSVSAQSAKTYELAAFNAIRIQGPFLVTLTSQSDPVVKLSGSDEIIRYTTVRIKGDRLEILYERDRFSMSKMERLSVEVGFQQLDDLQASGAAKVEVIGTINSEKLRFDLSGASTFKGDIETDYLSIDLSGASTAELAGFAAAQGIDLSGASSYKARDLSANTITFDASGASNMTVTANELIKGDASGASSISYYGQPNQVDVSTSGASSVKKRD